MNSDSSKLTLGIIPDGNRRWAKVNSLDAWEGHRKGIEVVEKILLPQLKNHPEVANFILYAFSTENWQRPRVEVEMLMSLLKKNFSPLLETLIANQIRFKHAGRRDRLDEEIIKQLDEITEKTAQFTDLTFYLCLDYGGQDEICRAFAKAAESGLRPAEITPEKLQPFLDIPHLVDLILRTSGEQRISGFLPFQTAYSELFFLRNFFPELTSEQVEKVLSDFSDRNRRRGR